MENRLEQIFAEPDYTLFIDNYKYYPMEYISYFNYSIPIGYIINLENINEK